MLSENSRNKELEDSVTLLETNSIFAPGGFFFIFSQMVVFHGDLPWDNPQQNHLKQTKQQVYDQPKQWHYSKGKSLQMAIPL